MNRHENYIELDEAVQRMIDDPTVTATEIADRVGVSVQTIARRKRERGTNRPRGRPCSLRDEHCVDLVLHLKATVIEVATKLRIGIPAARRSIHRGVGIVWDSDDPSLVKARGDYAMPANASEVRIFNTARADEILHDATMEQIVAIASKANTQPSLVSSYLERCQRWAEKQRKKTGRT